MPRVACPDETDYAMIPADDGSKRFSVYWARPIAHALATATALLAVCAVGTYACASSSSDHSTFTAAQVLKESAAVAPWHGVSLGGWLVMEINPSKAAPDAPIDLRPQWMYDQIEAASELDFVASLRAEHGDAYAITTMRNHWSHYYTPAMLDAARALGVDTVRLPVGYWIMDPPVAGSGLGGAHAGTPREYGISPEGFVTGGLNHLHDMLVALHARGMRALVDLHASPCNSACVSDGMYCAVPLAFVAAGDAPIGDIERCGGGVYPTRRTRRSGEATWGDVGVNALEALAKWLAQLPPEASGAVRAMQLANEPALAADAGLGAPDRAKEDAVNAYYVRALSAARAHLPHLPLVLSFIPVTERVTAFVQGLRATDDALLADHHYYLNFQQPYNMTWGEIHARACAAPHNPHGIGWDLYTDARLPLIFGEWSLAVDHDAPLDLSDEGTRAELRQLYAEQLDVFGATPGLRGAFFWTLRMGSGWDPRPTEAHPHGTQLDGSNAWRSLPGYPFPVWSLLELSAAGIAAPLNRSYAGTCARRA